MFYKLLENLDSPGTGGLGFGGLGFFGSRFWGFAACRVQGRRLSENLDPLTERSSCEST